MNNANKFLILASIICFLLSIFQIIIGFSPSWSLYFGAPDFLIKSPNTLITVSIIIGFLLIIFGLYALSGAKIFIKLPLLKPILLGIGLLFLLRGCLLFPELLRFLKLIEDEPIESKFIIFSVISLIIGFIFIKGICIMNKNNFPKR